MTRINPEKDHWDGCYDADLEQQDFVVNEKYLKTIPVEATIKGEDGQWWHCYLVKATLKAKEFSYYLTYAEY